MTGELDEQMRESLTRLLEAVVKGDARGATEAYLEMAPQGSEKVNRAALLMDIKAVLYEIHRSDLAEVSIGDSFELLLRAGSRHGVHNPGEFFLLTRTFVILESMIRQLDPDHDYLKSFREEITRLTEKHFSLNRIKEKTGKLVREMERLINDAPGDTRRILRRFSEGNLGQVQAPALETMGNRANNNLERLSGVMISCSLLVAGALLVVAQRDGTWHHNAGQTMIVAGIIGIFTKFIGEWLRKRGRR
jgi:ubiquinone biosynthesis protein